MAGFLELNRDLFPNDITASELQVGDSFLFAVDAIYTVTDSGDYTTDEVPLGIYIVTEDDNTMVGGRVLNSETIGSRTTINVDVVDGGCQYTVETDATSGVHASPART